MEEVSQIFNSITTTKRETEMDEIFCGDNDMAEALERFNQAIVEYEQTTGRQYTIIVAPHTPNEKPYVSLNGIESPLVGAVTPAYMLRMAEESAKK